MQYKIFSIPFSGDVDGEEEMNLFLRQHKIVSVARETACVNGSSYWTFCVEYLEGGTPSSSTSSSPRYKQAKIDYREVLSESDFAVYAALRDWRKEVSIRETLPVYTICTNEQLAFFARNRPVLHADLLQNPGFGEGKCERYGDAIIAVVQQHAHNNAESIKTNEEQTCAESED